MIFYFERKEFRKKAISARKGNFLRLLPCDSETFEMDLEYLYPLPRFLNYCYFGLIISDNIKEIYDLRPNQGN